MISQLQPSAENRSQTKRNVEKGVDDETSRDAELCRRCNYVVGTWRLYSNNDSFNGEMMSNPDRHSPKKGAPDYRKAYGDELLAHQKTSRDLKAKQDNEVNLLRRIEALDIDVIELNNRDIVHIKTVCLQCSKQEKGAKELVRVKKEKRSSVIINWALFGVIVLMIIWSI